MKQYGAFSKVYDEIYLAKKYREYARFILRILSAHGHPVSSLLDVGCGTGTLIRYLKKDIPDCTGIDTSVAMLKYAKAKNPKQYFRKDSVLSFSFRKKFDAITCTFDVLNYLPTVRQLEVAIRNIRDHLDEQGVFFGDFNTPDKVFVPNFTQKGVDFISTQTPSAWTVRLRIPEKNRPSVEIHRERLYTREQVELSLRQAGFKRIEWYKSFSKRQRKGEKPPRLIFAAWI